jgi:ABC-type polysaccharide/polyol phosphate transport system ATPase subunit
MSRPVITAQHVGKTFRLGDRLAHDTLRDHLADAGRGLLQRLRGRAPVAAAPRAADSFNALDDLSFEIFPGDTVGIIGRNGAGKSTLLKILSQISEPTTGEIRVRGRLAALLEVGAGFHPELTGRENVFLNGSILGMSRAEIRRKFDEIVAFAEVEKFLDTPVKRYSSGMYVRLAFAVAAHLEADIMVVDEVLAVGDAAFQAKCLKKMGDITSGEGRAILFVSHNLAAVQRLCARGLYLEAGQLKIDGPIFQALDAYQRSFERATESAAEPAALPEGSARLLRWHMEGSSTGDPHSCLTRETCTFVITLASRLTLGDGGMSFIIWNLEGGLVLHGNMREAKFPPYRLREGQYEFRVRVRLPIKAGLYQVDVRIYSESGGVVDNALLEPKLHILPDEHTSSSQWEGMITEPLEFSFAELP